MTSKKALHYLIIIGLLISFSCTKSKYQISQTKRGKWNAVYHYKRVDRDNNVVSDYTHNYVLYFIDESKGRGIGTYPNATPFDFTWNMGEEGSGKPFIHFKYFSSTNNSLYFVKSATTTFEHWEFFDVLSFSRSDQVFYNIDLNKQ